MTTAAIISLGVIALWLVANLIARLIALYRRWRGTPPKPINWNLF
jgi:hypothetical protein